MHRLYNYTQTSMKSIFMFSSFFVWMCKSTVRSEDTDKLLKRKWLRTEREDDREGGHIPEHFCPLVEVCQSTLLQLTYSRSGSAVRIVWGFLLIAPPLPPEGWLWSVHTFKFQSSKKKKKTLRANKAHSFINAATGIRSWITERADIIW